MPLEVCALSPEKMELREYEVPKVGKGQMKVQEHVRCGQARNRVIGHKRRQRETRPL